MKPKKQERKPIDDIFRLRLEQILDQRHALYCLAGKISWSLVEERFGGLYSEKGRPGIPIRLMVGLHYLKHAFNESDETVVSRWVENPSVTVRNHLHKVAKRQEAELEGKPDHLSGCPKDWGNCRSQISR